MPRNPNPVRTDQDTPEARAEWFDKARPASEVLSELLGSAAAREMLKPKRGRPTLTHPQEHVNIRLDADVVDAVKDSEAGWKTRINNALREWLKTHPGVQKGQLGSAPNGRTSKRVTASDGMKWLEGASVHWLQDAYSAAHQRCSVSASAESGHCAAMYEPCANQGAIASAPRSQAISTSSG